MFRRKCVYRVLLGLIALSAVSASSEAGTDTGYPPEHVLIASQLAWAEEATRPTVAVLVYNYEQIPATIMEASTASVARVYGDAGIDINWLNPLEDSKYVVSPTSNSLMSFTVEILIRARRAPRWATTPERVLGTAFPANNRGGTLSLYYEEIQRTARQYHQPVERILALTIAHEMGHLLLPYPAHSTTGVMVAKWDGQGLRAIARSSLQFTPGQASAMRSKISGCCAATADHGSR